MIEEDTTVETPEVAEEVAEEVEATEGEVLDEAADLSDEEGVDEEAE